MSYQCHLTELTQNEVRGVYRALIREYHPTLTVYDDNSTDDVTMAPCPLLCRNESASYFEDVVERDGVIRAAVTKHKLRPPASSPSLSSAALHDKVMQIIIIHDDCYNRQTFLT
jgi:hypothetical protein